MKYVTARLSNLCQGLRHTLSEICTKFDAVPLSDPSRNRISPYTRLQIKTTKQTPWSETASELHRQSDRHLSAKLVQILRTEGAT
jgi:hypothetical protein